MPSIEESENEEQRTSKNENATFSNLDVEVLVQEIKENLRLSNFKSRSSCNRQLKATRPSPYRVPSRSRSWGDSVCDECSKQGHRHCRHLSAPVNSRNSTTSDDPYEILQELLRDGGLIKEAVRRLGRPSVRKSYLYDSDEECRTPLRVCNVDL